MASVAIACALPRVLKVERCYIDICYIFISLQLSLLASTLPREKKARPEERAESNLEVDLHFSANGARCVI